MKWVSFADSLPPNIEWVQYRTKEGATPYVEVSCRVIESKVPFSVYDILNRAEVNVKEYFVTTGYRQGRITQGYTLDKIEWLEETEQSIEESRCCEQNDKLRAEIYKLSGIEEDKPLGDHFNALKNKLGSLVSEIEMDYMRYRDSKMSYRNFINKWL